MRRLRLYLRLSRLLIILSIGLLLAAWLQLRSLLGLRNSQALHQRLTRWFLAKLAAALPFRVRLVGRRPTQPMLWLANHQSWSDIPLIGMLLPISFLAKAEVRQWPLVGWLAAQAGTLFIRRGGGESRQVCDQLAHHLRQGRDLLLFPEGTTTDGNRLCPFHPRLLACALETGTPIQPVAIRYRRDGKIDPIAPFIGEDDLLSHLLRLLVEDVADVDIYLLPPIESRGLDRNGLARLAHCVVAEALFDTVEPASVAA